MATNEPMEADVSKLLIVLGVLGVALLIALDLYVGGRIMLPAIGLKAVEFWTCFWFVIWSFVFSSPLFVLAAWLRN